MRGLRKSHLATTAVQAPEPYVAYVDFMQPPAGLNMAAQRGRIIREG